MERSAAVIEVQLFGDFRARKAGGGADIHIATRKARGLLAYLILRRGEPSSREILADLLWGDRVDAQARQNLRQCMVSLRRDLEPFAPDLIVAEGETLAIRPGRAAADALEFELLAKSKDASDLLRAAALYRGPLLAGLDLGVEAFEEWVRDERRRLAERAGTVLRQCAEHCDQSGDGDSAVAHAQRLRALDPLREDWLRFHLRLVARYCGRDAALAEARTAAALIHRETGAALDAETAVLVDAIAKMPGEAPPVLAPTAATSSVSVAPPSTVGFARQRQRQRRLRRIAAAGLAASAVAVGTLTLGFSGSDDGTLPPPRPAQPQAAATPDGAPDNSAAARAMAERGMVPIVVLPFQSPSMLAEDRARANAFTDDLVTLLARVPRLKVAGHQTTARFRERPADLAALERDLGVIYALEGSVRRDGEQVTVNVRLVNLRNQLQSWSRSFTRPLSASVGPNSELLLGVGRELQLAVFDAEADYAVGTYGADDTRSLLARAMARTMRHTTREDRIYIRELLEEVLRRDPDNAAAVLTLVSAIVDQVNEYQSSDPEKDFARAEELLKKARILAPRANTRHNFMGRIHKARGDYAAAQAEFEQALEINPSHTSSLAHLGHVLFKLGRFAQGREHIERAMRISPNDPSMTFWLAFLGDGKLDEGDAAAAVDYYKQSVAKRPHNGRSHLRLGAGYLLLGDTANAAHHLARYRQLVPAEQRQGIEMEYAKHFDPGRKHVLKIHHAIRRALAEFR